MQFEQALKEIQKSYPEITVKYKDQSLFMKFLGKMLFFNKDFMTKYTTTIGSTVYFPSKSFTDLRPLSALIVLLHELVHSEDAKYSKILFGFLYLSPQVFALMFFPLLFISFKLSLLSLLFLLPIPSYFRKYYEVRGYSMTLFVMSELNKKGMNYDLKEELECIKKHFKSSEYYYMYPFIDKEMDELYNKIINEELPFDSELFVFAKKIVDLV